MTPQQRARQLLDQSANMTVATVAPDGQPWVSPVFFVPDGDYDLYWTSEPSARHSANIRADGRVAIVVVQDERGKPVDGVYLTAEAVELSDPEEITRALSVMAAKSQPERWRINGPEDVSGAGPWRIYRAHPLSIEVRSSDTVAGKPVARREPADFRLSGGSPS